MALPATEPHNRLERGAKGAEVEALQALLNRVGALLSTDGDFGGGTEGALREAQMLAGLPVNGAADAATWQWLENQPEPSGIIPTEAVTFIVREEVGGRKFYDEHVAMPHFPGEASGVTIGVGYDLRFQEPQDFEADWTGILTPAQMDALRPHLGKKGSQGAVNALSNLRIPFHAAWKVFVKRALPRGIEQTESCYGDLAKLPPLCRGALVSLVYNRGTKLSGDSRREMKAIRDHIAGGALDEVAAEFERMKRLWPGSEGLRKRRDKEAAMWRQGLAQAGPPGA
ncbi:peptidoglycan-binding protein [Pelagibius sp. CAU 1746]|uniref:peptidoglycan-binding protein n=1 Tax=Pelagibius sp. CAU 1746 TaxID=3140370 RepID=UPI00325A5198